MKTLFDPLTKAERNEFTQRDARFTNAWTGIWAAIEDLDYIRRNRLYREEFVNFEDYLRNRCQIGKAYAYQLIEAHSVYQKVKERCAGVPRVEEICNERQCRELTKVPDDLLKPVVEKAISLCDPKKPVTSQILKRACLEVLGPVPQQHEPSSLETSESAQIAQEPLSENQEIIDPLVVDAISVQTIEEQQTTEPSLDPELEAQKLFERFDHESRRIVFETISNLWHLENGGRKPKRKTFTKPTIEDIQRYCQSRNSSVDPEAFFDHYTQTGWKMTNGLQVNDWQACVRTWERRDKQRSGYPSSKEKELPSPASKPWIPSALEPSKPRLRPDLAARIAKSTPTLQAGATSGDH
ncbi:MAG: hypothetical protein ACKN82_20620 [Pirellula sp.]